MDYIAQVLPNLGESNITQTTFENFAIGEINIKEAIKGFSKYVEDAIEGDEESLKEFKYKASKEFVNILEEKVEYLNKNYFKIRSVSFSGEEIVSVNEIKELFDVYYKDMPLFRRSEKIRRILTSKIKKGKERSIIWKRDRGRGK